MANEPICIVIMLKKTFLEKELFFAENKLYLNMELKCYLRITYNKLGQVLFRSFAHYWQLSELLVYIKIFPRKFFSILISGQKCF